MEDHDQPTKPDLDKLFSAEAEKKESQPQPVDIMEALGLKPREYTDEERKTLTEKEVARAISATESMKLYLEKVSPIIADQMVIVYKAMRGAGFDKAFSQQAALVILEKSVKGND